MEALLNQLIVRRAEMEQAIFQHPPEDWAAFQRRMGAWVELSNLIISMQEALNREDD